MTKQTDGYVAGLGSGCLWGCNNFLFAIGASAFTAVAPAMPASAFPLVGAAVNDAFAALTMLFLYGMRRRLNAFYQEWRSRRGGAILLAAFLGGPVGQVCYAAGILWAGPSYALIITSSYPILGSLIAHIFLHQPMKRTMWGGTFLVVCGAALVSYLPAQGDVSFRGLVASVVAAGCWALEIVLATWGMQKMTPEAAITFREMISGSVLTVIAAVLLMADSVPLVPVACAAVQTPTLFVAGMAAGFSYLLDYRANHLLGCARGMTLNATYILWGVVLNVLFAGACLHSVEIIGCFLVFAGVFLTCRETRA